MFTPTGTQRFGYCNLFCLLCLLRTISSLPPSQVHKRIAITYMSKVQRYRDRLKIIVPSLISYTPCYYTTVILVYLSTWLCHGGHIISLYPKQYDMMGQTRCTPFNTAFNKAPLIRTSPVRCARKSYIVRYSIAKIGYKRRK